MLGWEFFVTLQRNQDALQAAPEEPTLARWLAGLGGTRWIDSLVASGLAKDLGGNGYPDSYLLSAGILTAALTQGIPWHDGPTVLGDDYFYEGGWSGNMRINIERLRSLDPSEQLLVEAWDQS